MAMILIMWAPDPQILFAQHQLHKGAIWDVEQVVCMREVQPSLHTSRSTDIRNRPHPSHLL